MAMIEAKTDINEGGVNGLGLAETDTKSEEFKVMQKMMLNIANQRTDKERQEIILSGLRAEMHLFADKAMKQQTGKTAPQFLRAFIDAIGVKNKIFAEYLHIKESNLSAILNGNRRINIELAYKLGELFEVRPELWLQVQSKHEMLLFAQENRDKYKKYNWKDLVKRA